MTTVTNNPQPTTDTQALRDLEAALGRIVSQQTSGMQSKIDQVTAGQADLTGVRQALEALDPIVSRHTDQIGDLNSRLGTIASLLQTAGTTLLQQAQNLPSGNLDSSALTASRQQLQEVAQQLQEVAATAASRLERIETALGMDPDTGRSRVLDDHGWRLHHVSNALDMDATGQSGHVNKINALLGLDRPDGQPDIIKELTAGQEAIATAVAGVNSALLMQPDGRADRIERIESRVAALENQGGGLGRSLLIGGAVGLVTWLFVAVVFATPGWVDIVIGLTTFLAVTGVAMFLGGGNSRRPARPRHTPRRVVPTRTPAPANQRGNGQNPATPANPPANQA